MLDVNRAWSIRHEASKPDAPKVLIKEESALRRGSALASFYFVEAYLNSIAFDHPVGHYDKLSPNDRDRITEWDHAKNKERLVSFRDKLLSYPRIVLGLAAPPLQENNCPEVKFLLEEAKGFRDAIVHANPRPAPFTQEPVKQVQFWRIGSATSIELMKGGRSYGNPALGPVELWTSIVDNSIEVVEKIELLIHSNRERLWWMKRRGDDGSFPESVFD